MGQYYKFIILAENNEILLVIIPHDFGLGAKLMEHSYITNSQYDNKMMNTIEYLLSPYSNNYHKSRCVMTGDYADNEKNTDQNLYTMSKYCIPFQQGYVNININYIVNHTKKLYVNNINNNNNNIIHPLPLLICEGNGRGGGDYNGTDYNLVGTWARDVISMEFDKPDNYTELICEFKEEY